MSAHTGFRVPRRLPAWLSVIVLALLPTLGAWAVEVRVIWIEERPDQGILTPTGLLAFHDGQIDFFDHRRPAPALLAQALPELQKGRPPHALSEQLRADFPDAEFRGMVSEPIVLGAFSPPIPRYPTWRSAVLELDPARHRYLSWLWAVQPGNDAFVGNEDPFRHRLFDDDGQFLGPMYIDVYGSDVLDAGLCDNTEFDLVWLDLAPGPEPQPCTGGEGMVRAHPGLNGSLRNPDALPVGILGATSIYSTLRILRFDTEAADFTRPGTRLGRFIIGRQATRGDATGSWYSPARDGEGFSVQRLPPGEPDGPPRLLVYWYTYAADGSGRQAWLAGLGEFDRFPWHPIVIDLHDTHGGRFDSTDNPDTVVRSPWGELQMRFTSCSTAEISYQSDDPAFGSGAFEVFRLGDPGEGLDWLCDPDDHALPQP